MSKRKKRRLKHLQIEEVSWVDSPANLRPFMFVKSSEDSTVQKQEYQGLDLRLKVDDTSSSAALTINGKRIKSPTHVALSYIDWLTEDGPSPTGDEFGLSVEYGEREEDEDGFSREVRHYLNKGIEKAEWSTEYINDLPDSAFLYIESGGDKDEDGKTTPRSLRHLPYKNNQGNIDLPHLRNAIARIPQMEGISEDKKNALQAKARKILETESEKMSIDKNTIRTIKAVSPEVDDDIDPALAEGLAKGAKVISEYSESMPPALQGAIAEIIKLATETEADESNDTPESNETEERDNDESPEQQKPQEQPEQPENKPGGDTTLAEDRIAQKVAEAVVQALKEQQEPTNEEAAEDSNEDQEDVTGADEKDKDDVEETLSPEEMAEGVLGIVSSVLTED